MSKPTAKAPAAKKTPAKKAAEKPSAKPAPAPKPAKTVSKTSAKSPAAPAKAPAKSAAKPADKAAASPAAKVAEKAAPTKAAPVKPQSKAEPKAAPKAPSAAPLQPMSATPAPAPNRFTDRFAPAPRLTPVAPMAEAAKPIPKDPKLVNAWKSKAGRDLTEPEVLAMPDNEYMNDKQLEFFRVRLERQKDDLLSSAGETTEHLREDTSIVPDPVDRATIEEEHALELRTRDRERKLLKKISQSLARIDNGEYGYCDETGEPIGLARLMARPTATLSLEAQQRRELKQKMFGD